MQNEELEFYKLINRFYMRYNIDYYIIMITIMTFKIVKMVLNIYIFSDSQVFLRQVY